MSQNYTDNCFAPGHVGQTDLQNMENNFAALKSGFSGASAPSNPVAGMIWIDTTNDLLKRYYDGSWISIWDLANNKPIITNLSNEITSSMISSAIKDAAAGTASLRTLGTGANQAAAGNQPPPDGSVTEAKLASSVISQAKLKTSTQSQSYDITAYATHKFVLTGGQYCFSPLVKGESNDIILGFAEEVGTSYINLVMLKNDSDSNRYGYVQHRYVTSSGEVYWIFILKDKATGKIIGTSACDDHPSFGYNGNHEMFPHPFTESYDSTKHEIVVINPAREEIHELKKKTSYDRCLTQVIGEDYDIDDTIKPPWPTTPVTVGLPPEWEEKSTGSIIKPIRKVIPKPSMVKTARLRLKRQNRRI